MPSAANLVTFGRYLQRNGYKVGEHPDFGVVHDVHMEGSWHYKRGALDINYGTNGSVERARLLDAMHAAISLGFAVTFAWKGTKGSAKGHQNHLHVDIGPWSNHGLGDIRATGAVTSRLPDGSSINGPTAPPQGGDASIRSVQQALKTKYPAYAKHLVVDGINGPKTRAAVVEFQKRAGLVPDGIAGPRTRKALGLA